MKLDCCDRYIFIYLMYDGKKENRLLTERWAFIAGSEVTELLPRSKKEPEAVPLSQPDPGEGDPAGWMEEHQQRDQIFLSEGCSTSGVEIQDRSRDELGAVPVYRCHFTSKEHGDLAAVR